MKCPICEGKSSVKETRESPTFGVRRRRVCENNHWFTTREAVIPKEQLDEERRNHQEAFKQYLVAVRQGRRKAS